MGINPDTYAPASPSSAAASSAAASTFPATRHMAQWESARLEAEARLSRESLLFSSTSSAAAAALSTTADLEPPPEDSPLPSTKPQSDFFLRIWNSEVGDSFRKPLTALPSPVEETPIAPPTAAESKSCLSTAGGPDSSSSNEADEASDDTYQLYLNLGGDDLGLFHGQLGAFSIFSTDLNDAVFLDTAFK